MGDREDAGAAVVRLADEWMAAVARRDIAALDRLLGEEYTLTTGQGVVRDRASWLHNVAHDVVVRDFAYHDVRTATARWW